jgi:hypothetical protein
MKIDHGEPKKSRHFTLTDTAYNHLKDIAHDARKSLSETLERLIRSTPIWEGSATLSDGAFSLIEDYSSPDSSSEDYEGYTVD